MDVNILRELMTVVSFTAFVGIVWFAVHPGNGKRFDEAARLPLEEDQPPPEPSPKGEGPNVGSVFAKQEQS